MKYVGEIYIVFTGDGISPAWNGDCLFYKAMDYFPAEGEESQGTATVAANGNGISVDPASANAIDNGQSRVANNSNSSPPTNEDIGRLASIMPNLPAQVQEQVRQAMAMTL